MKKSIPIESYDPHEFMSDEEFSEEISMRLKTVVERINNNDDSDFITEEEFYEHLEKKDKELEEMFTSDFHKKLKERYLPTKKRRF